MVVLLREVVYAGVSTIKGGGAKEQGGRAGRELT